MIEDQPETSCRLLRDIQSLCRRRHRCGQRKNQAATPLPESCCNSRVRVCAVTGDRKTCARMANLGVLPGSELELLCKGGGQQCVIKINGGTISLDASTAAAILVTPA